MTADPAIRAVAALQDELRAGMYAHIRRAGRPVTRDEAAAAVGISRKLAAFHLDKLVDAGVLRASRGPVATGRVGRRPKTYEPAELDIRISIPPRQHDLLATILLDALLSTAPGAPGPTPPPSDPHRAEVSGGAGGTGGGEDARAAALRVAYERGRAVGQEERAAARPGRLGTERALTLVTRVLERRGFEPDRTAPTCLRLRTCPFHPLASRAPAVVCRINHAFLAGVADGLRATTLDVVLVPPVGACCVELRATGDAPTDR